MAGNYFSPITGNDPMAQAANSAFKFFSGMYNGPTQEEQRMSAAKKALVEARTREAIASADKTGLEVDALGMRNNAATGLADLFGRYQTDLASPPEQERAVPTAVGPMPQMTQDMVNAEYRPQMIDAASRLAIGKPGNIGDAFAAIMGMAPGGGVGQPDMDRAMLGAGKSFGDTAQGVDVNNAADLAQVIARQELANEGAMARHTTPGQPSSRPTPRNYVGPDGSPYITFDGINEARSGMALPAGGYLASVQSPTADGAGLTTGTQTELQKGELAATNFDDLINVAREIGTDARNFGLSGSLRGTVQDAMQQGSALANTLGAKAQEAQQDLVGMGSDVSLEAFDPRLSQLETMENLLAYQLAKFNDPGGRVTDADFRAAKQSLGLSGLLSNQAKFMSRLDLLQNMIGQKKARGAEALRGDTPPIATGTKRIRIDTEGNVIE